MKKRYRRTSIAVAVAALLGLLALCPAQAAPARSDARRVDACKLNEAALRAASPIWRLNLTERDSERTVDPPGVVCTWNDDPAKADSFYHLSLAFYVAPSAGAAQANLAQRVKFPGAKALRGTGADRAFAKETSGPLGTWTSTSSGWRKGRYWGSLLLSGNGLNGDVDDARDILRQFFRRLPR